MESLVSRAPSVERSEMRGVRSANGPTSMPAVICSHARKKMIPTYKGRFDRSNISCKADAGVIVAGAERVNGGGASLTNRQPLAFLE